MRCFGLIGYPLEHSFSKKYFTEKFIREDLQDCSFELYPLPSVNLLPELLESLPALCGLSVTIPYKQQVLSFVHEQAEEVRKTGAANCIRIRAGKLTAFNTDITGFRISFSECLQPHHTRALVLGTGGASRAVQYVLDELGIEYKLVSRSPKEGTYTYQQLNAELIQSFPVIINATPIGMYPHVGNLPPIPYEYIGPGHYLYDLVYRPNPTMFLQQGANGGAVVKAGMDMLELQAEASWEIWNTGV